MIDMLGSKIYYSDILDILLDILDDLFLWTYTYTLHKTPLQHGQD